MGRVNTGGWGTARTKRQTACHPGEPHYANGLCRQCYRNTPAFQATRRAYYQRNRERFKVYGQQQTERCTRLTKAYGVSRADVQAMRVKQGRVCAICGEPPKTRALNVDHNHASGQVRGLLCGACNRGVGLFRDNPELLRKAAEYLYERDDSVQAPTAAVGRASSDGRETVRRAGLPSTVRENSAGDQSSAERRADLSP